MYTGYSLDTTERVTGQKKCPLCRSPLPQDGIASIPTNFSTNRLIEIFYSRRTDCETSNTDHAVSKCDECEDGAVARMWCVDCGKGLCDECFKPHTKFRSLKSHKTVTMDEFTKNPKAVLTANPKPQYYNMHNDQPLELYCITCSKLICRDCIYIDHPCSNHQFEFLRKVITEEQAKIKEIAAPLQLLLERVQVAIKNNEASK